MEQFEIFPIFSLSLTIPHTIGYLILAGFLSILLTYVGTGSSSNIESTSENSKYSRGSLVPSAYAVTHESLFRSILLMVDTYMSTIYFPLIYTIFHVILFSNLIGMIPYSSTPSAEIIMTLSLAFTVLIGVLILGFISHKLYLLAAFIPAGTPLGLIPLMILLEVMAYLTRTLSLGLRLAVNMITGHILVKVCVSFIWVAYLNGTSLIFLTLPMFLLTLFLALE